jgi:hypothetical protein
MCPNYRMSALTHADRTCTCCTRVRVRITSHAGMRCREHLPYVRPQQGLLGGRQPWENSNHRARPSRRRAEHDGRNVRVMCYVVGVRVRACDVLCCGCACACVRVCVCVCVCACVCVCVRECVSVCARACACVSPRRLFVSYASVSTANLLIDALTCTHITRHEGILTFPLAHMQRPVQVRTGSHRGNHCSDSSV